MAWYRKHYEHLECNAVWEDDWSCACNDRCPVCDSEIEPTDYVNLTVVVEFDNEAKEWVALLSPPEAEDSPRYRETRFKKEHQARAFIAASGYLWQRA